MTRQRAFVAEGAQTAASLDEALERVDVPDPAFVIGGSELFRDALPSADTLHITEIARAFDGDVTFPPFDRARWREVAREPGRSGGPDAFDYAFVTYERAS